MGSLLERAREMNAAVAWQPENVGDGIEGTILQIRPNAGRKYDTTDFFLETNSGEKILLRVNSGTQLAARIDENKPKVGDKLAALYLAIPVGKKYKKWSVLCEHAVTKSDGDGRGPDEGVEDGEPSDDEIPF